MAEAGTGLPGLYVVCDGMGGTEGGGVAARLTVDVFRARSNELTKFCRRWMKILESVSDVDERLKKIGWTPDGWLRGQVEAANEAVRSRADSDAVLNGMGTTMAAVLVWANQATVGWVGDSRVYHISPRGEIWRTADDTDEEGALLRDIGGESEVTVSVRAIEPEPGDRFLICSDGLYKPHGEECFARMLLAHARSRSPRKMCLELLESSLSLSDDNITSICVFVDAVG